MDDKVQMVMDVAFATILCPVSLFSYKPESLLDSYMWWINQDIIGPFLYTQVSSCVEALEETGINAGFYAPIINDVESFFEIMFC